MSDKSKIDWTDATWQVTAGCTKVSPGCANCYAATMAKRLRAMGLPAYQNVVTDKGQWTGWVGCLPGNLPIPLHWRKPRRIFVDSMSDLFHPSVPFEFIDRVFGVMAQASWHTFQILSKRPDRASHFCRPRHAERLRHVWIGTSLEGQAIADIRGPALQEVAAAVRWYSVEPLLEPIPRLPLDGIGWVVVGCESGPRRRLCNPDWIRSIVDQCQAVGCPVFVKQFPIARHRKGNPAPHKVSTDPAEWPEWARVRQFPQPHPGEKL